MAATRYARVMKRMRISVVAGSALMLFVAGCGGSDDGPDTTVAAVAETTVPPETTVPVETTAPVETTVAGAADTTVAGHGGDHDTTVAVEGVANACPVDGCTVGVKAIGKSGAELQLEFTPNFTPSMAKNHIHVYWDKYKAEQVSNDAEPKYGVKQGEWVPTDQVSYVTEGASSVTARGESHTVCVTAGDRNHNVVDPTVVSCVDVSSLL